MFIAYRSYYLRDAPQRMGIIANSRAASSAIVYPCGIVGIWTRWAVRAYDRGHPLAPSLLLAATNPEVNMFAWLKNRLCGKKEPAIAAGETWEFVDLPVDPWGGGKPFRVQILDVRDGWVRYSMGNVFPDERHPVGRFVSMYRRVDVQPPAGA